ncbi:MAG: hypothetical protein ACXWHB_14855 [Usitatibacter sp.]
MPRIAAALLVLLFPALSPAATVTPDYTDMWWNSDESGWGANVIQQGDTMMVTLFVYDANRNPTWFVAPSVVYQGNSVFTGQMYETTGPWYFPRTFDASSVTVNAVGTLTFTATDPTHAVLQYSVGALVVNKNVMRQSWRTDNHAGFYFGGRQGVWSGCGPPLDGKVDSRADVSVTETGDQIQIRDAGKGYTCAYSGRVTQAGHYAEIVGTGVCNDDGVSRFLKATEVQVTDIMFSMRYRMEQIGTSCVFEGYAGGIREVQ